MAIFITFFECWSKWLQAWTCWFTEWIYSNERNPQRELRWFDPASEDLI